MDRLNRVRFIKNGFTFLWCLLIVSAARAELVEVQRVDILGQVAREPMIVQHPSGSLFVSGFGSQITGTDWTKPPLLWRSDDNGESWQRVDVGTSSQNAQGNSDVDLAIGPDGTLYFVSMGFNRATERGTQIAVGVSRDIGKTWSWTMLSCQDLVDRPWIAVSPGNVAHVVWSDGKGVQHFVSDDFGGSWRNMGRVNSRGGSSHLAVGHGGNVAVRIGPVSGSGHVEHEGVDLIALSRDGGDSWSKYAIPGDIRWDADFERPGSVPRWVDPLAWGRVNTLYHLWSEGQQVWLGQLDDTNTNERWDKRVIAVEKGTAFFPFLSTNVGEKLVATWFVRDGEQLLLRVALINLSDDGESDNHQIALADLVVPQTWVDTIEAREPDSAGEYAPVLILIDGSIGVVTPIQDAHANRYGFTWRRFEGER